MAGDFEVEDFSRRSKTSELDRRELPGATHLARLRKHAPRRADFGIEMPPMLVGRMHDREQRAADYHQRAIAVVEKATNLIALDVEAQFLKWQEAAAEIKEFSEILPIATALPDKVQKLQPKDFTGPALVQANTTAVMVRTQLNDALHIHALALVGLERATAGAFTLHSK